MRAPRISITVPAEHTIDVETDGRVRIQPPAPPVRITADTGAFLRRGRDQESPVPEPRRIPGGGDLLELLQDAYEVLGEEAFDHGEQYGEKCAELMARIRHVLAAYKVGRVGKVGGTS